MGLRHLEECHYLQVGPECLLHPRNIVKDEDASKTIDVAVNTCSLLFNMNLKLILFYLCLLCKS